MQVQSGRVLRPRKVVVYGPEGIGKSTFASRFPDPIFIDTEDSTLDLDVNRLPRPQSWAMLLAQVEHILQNPTMCQTLVIDTADWAEELCSQHIMAQNKWSSIETPGYGKGYVVLAEEFGRLLNLLTRVLGVGINVVVTAHAMMRKFEQPDADGSYDRWELKLQKKTAPKVKEWADEVLFINFKTFIVNKNQVGKGKGKGQERVMYANHNATWDAKNRLGLPDENEFSYDIIAPFIFKKDAAAQVKTQAPPVSEAHPQAPPQTPPVQEAPKAAPEEVQTPPPTPAEDLSAVPDNLRQLMEANDVSLADIMYAVASKGYFPLGTEFAALPQEFVQGVLVGAWNNGLLQMIQDLKQSKPIQI